MAETPFKLRSGNSPLFKQMGSSPLQHGVKNPDTGKKEYTGHKHEGMGLFERLTGKKWKDTQLGKDIKDLGTDIKEKKKLGYTKSNRAKLLEESNDGENTGGENTGGENTDVSERKHNIKVKQTKGDLPKGTWKKIEENVGGKENMDQLLKNQSELEKGSKEWNINQNKINIAYGDDKRHPEE